MFLRVKGKKGKKGMNFYIKNIEKKNKLFFMNFFKNKNNSKFSSLFSLFQLTEFFIWQENLQKTKE